MTLPHISAIATHGLQWTTRLGWTVGGGAEWAVSDHWSIRGEYRYSEFGPVSDTPNVALPATLYGGARRLDQGQVQFGASYKFGDPLLVPVAAPVSRRQGAAHRLDRLHMGRPLCRRSGRHDLGRE